MSRYSWFLPNVYSRFITNNRLWMEPIIGDVIIPSMDTMMTSIDDWCSPYFKGCWFERWCWLWLDSYPMISSSYLDWSYVALWTTEGSWFANKLLVTGIARQVNRWTWLTSIGWQKTAQIGIHSRISSLHVRPNWTVASEHNKLPTLFTKQTVPYAILWLI